jgi:hypothetical protein
MPNPVYEQDHDDDDEWRSLPPHQLAAAAAAANGHELDEYELRGTLIPLYVFALIHDAILMRVIGVDDVNRIRRRISNGRTSTSKSRW